MTRFVRPLLGVACVAAWLGCGQKRDLPSIPPDAGQSLTDSGELADTGGTDRGSADAADVGAPEDLGAADAAVDGGPSDSGVVLRGIGDPCRNDFDCPRSGLCLQSTLNWNFSSYGYCTSVCNSDTDCGEGVCSSTTELGSRFCLLPCGSGRTCANPRHVCNDFVSGYTSAGQPVCFVGTATASPGDSCRNFGDCNINSVCINDFANFPGGACIGFGCVEGDDTTCLPVGGGTCRNGNDGPICVPGCTNDDDCRENYSCQGGVCRPAFVHPGFGAPCSNDRDCGPAPWQCLTGADYPGGYCTTVGCGFTRNCGPYICPSRGSCPILMACNDPTPGQADSGDEYCARPCAEDTECRAEYACLRVLPAVTTASICR